MLFATFNRLKDHCTTNFVNHANWHAKLQCYISFAVLRMFVFSSVIIKAFLEKRPATPINYMWKYPLFSSQYFFLGIITLFLQLGKKHCKSMSHLIKHFIDRSQLNSAEKISAFKWLQHKCLLSVLRSLPNRFKTQCIRFIRYATDKSWRIDPKCYILWHHRCKRGLEFFAIWITVRKPLVVRLSPILSRPHS